MSEVLKNIELIELYCEDKLSTEEKTNFENRLLVDIELAEEFKLYKVIVSGIKEKGNEDLRTRLKIADLELDANSGTVNELRPRKFNLKYWVIAASIILVIGIGWLWKLSTNNNLETIADTYYEKDKGLPNEMSTTKNELDKAMQAYKSDNFKEASIELDKLQSNKPINDTILFYNAVVKYELEDYKLAKDILSNINSESKYYQKAQYRAVLVELKLNNKTEAIKIIDESLVNKNHSYFDKLSQLKKELAN